MMTDAVPDPTLDVADLVPGSVEYTRSHFLTLETLAAQTGVAPELIGSYIEHRCVPRHSYAIVTCSSINSFFGRADGGPVEVRFYAPSHARWITETVRQSGASSLLALAEERRRWLYREYCVEIERTGPDLIPRDQLDAHLASEFEGWLDGTYGLCTVTATARDIARKELSILRIRALTQDGARAALSSGERSALGEAVRLLDQVSAPFAPHERARSSREKWIRRIAQRYQLPLPQSQVG